MRSIYHRDIQQTIVQDHLQYQHSFAVPFGIHHTVHPFLCNEDPYPIRSILASIQNTLYLLPLAPKKLQLLPVS